MDFENAEEINYQSRIHSKNSQILIGEGHVFHGRPTQSIGNGRKVKTAFKYPIFNLLLPINSEPLEGYLKNAKFLSIKSTDYLKGESGTFFDLIKKFMESKLNYSVNQVWLQTMPAMFGYVFNPISFWYFYKDNALDAILCEVNNTFGDRHFYFMRTSHLSNGDLKFSLPKHFHVSPFFPISGRYEFDFQLNASLHKVKIQLFEDRELILNTQINLKLTAFDLTKEWSLFWRYGWMTPLVVFRIHYQALKLFLNRVTFYSRPKPPKENITL